MFNSKFSFLSYVIIFVVSVLAVFLGLYNRQIVKANVSYNVFNDGKIIGNVKSYDSFIDYINNKQVDVKNEYGVSKVYLPSGVSIKKSYSFSDSFDDDSDVYNSIVEEDSFTIKCTIVTISYDEDDKDDLIIYVLNKRIFDDALSNMIQAFVGVDEYNNYVNSTQDKIVDTGSIIESIGIRENVTYKTGYVSVNEKIYTDSSELSRYLLYGTLDNQSTYIVNDGDTIEDIAYSHSLNVTEFLIANPSFSGASTLLYEGEEVAVGLINPVLSVEAIVHNVSDEVHPFATEIQYDALELTIYEELVRDGENGVDRVTKKLQYINGQLAESQNVSYTELTPSISRVIKKGSRVAPHIADLSYWAWPTARPYTITTYFGYRWGSMHDALDIAGSGYNSPIYAINNGVVVEVGTGCVAGYPMCNGQIGNFVVINHNVYNYYSMYAHMLSVNVRVGDTVERGSKIGTMGNTGFVVPSPSYGNPYAGTHLHFALYRGKPHGGGGIALNPLILY